MASERPDLGEPRPAVLDFEIECFARFAARGAPLRASNLAGCQAAIRRHTLARHSLSSPWEFSRDANLQDNRSVSPSPDQLPPKGRPRARVLAAWLICTATSRRG
jgi:hypothetical protein